MGDIKDLKALNKQCGEIAKKIWELAEEYCKKNLEFVEQADRIEGSDMIEEIQQETLDFLQDQMANIEELRERVLNSKEVD